MPAVDALWAVKLGLFVGIRENARVSYREQGLPHELFEPVYAVNLIRLKLEDFAAPGDTMMSRLDHVFDRLVIPMFSNEPQGNEREGIRNVYDLGVANAVVGRWWAQMGNLGLDDNLWLGEVEFVQDAPDGLAEAQLPIVTRNGCRLTRDDIRGYLLSYDGSIGAVHEMRFTAEAETANIWQMLKDGKLGRREEKTPLPRHVGALRELGFEQMVRPDGKRFRLSSVGGFSGIRRAKD